MGEGEDTQARGTMYHPCASSIAPCEVQRCACGAGCGMRAWVLKGSPLVRTQGREVSLSSLKSIK